MEWSDKQKEAAVSINTLLQVVNSHTDTWPARFGLKPYQAFRHAFETAIIELLRSQDVVSSQPDEKGKGVSS